MKWSAVPIAPLWVYTNLLKNIVSPIWLICHLTTEKNISKFVIVRKSKKKSSKCCQAELSSLTRWDFRAKKVKMFMLKKGTKFGKNEKKNIDQFIFTFSWLINIKSYKNQWPLERALKELSNAAKQIFPVQTIWILYQNEHTRCESAEKKIARKFEELGLQNCIQNLHLRLLQWIHRIYHTKKTYIKYL